MPDDRRRPASTPCSRPPVLRARRTKPHMGGRWVRVTALVMTAVVLPSTSASAGTDPTPAGAAAVDEFIRAEMAASSIPGAAVAITRGYEVLLVRGYGHDSRGAPVTGGTPFRVASLSKSFTSLAVLQLADAGLLSLDDRVVQHLPEFRLADPAVPASPCGSSSTRRPDSLTKPSPSWTGPSRPPRPRQSPACRRRTWSPLGDGSVLGILVTAAAAARPRSATPGR